MLAANRVEDHPEKRDLPQRIKSFVMRAGRTTLGQQRAIETLGAQFLIPFQLRLLNWAEAFCTCDVARLKILEIGFGMGEATAQIAQLRSGDDFLALEVHEPGVGALLKKIGDEHITNIRIIRHDAVEVLETMLADNTVDGVHIFFPDPWHKKKHNKRRLIQAPFIAQLCKKLKTGAYIHLATDWEEYAVQMLDVLLQVPQLTNTAGADTDEPNGLGGFVARPYYRPVTKFERRGLRLGHGVWDLVFIKSAQE